MAMLNYSRAVPALAVGLLWIQSDLPAQMQDKPRMDRLTVETYHEC
jgi:hypothetical protein